MGCRAAWAQWAHLHLLRLPSGVPGAVLVPSTSVLVHLAALNVGNPSFFSKTVGQQSNAFLDTFSLAHRIDRARADGLEVASQI
jgi:hypothetical protein